MSFCFQNFWLALGTKIFNAQDNSNYSPFWQPKDASFQICSFIFQVLLKLFLKKITKKDKYCSVAKIPFVVAEKKYMEHVLNYVINETLLSRDFPRYLGETTHKTHLLFWKFSVPKPVSWWNRKELIFKGTLFVSCNHGMT